MRQSPAKKVGLPPGAMVYIGEARDNSPKVAEITLVTVTPEHAFKQFIVQDILQLPAQNEFPQGTVFWYELEGIHDVNTVHALCDKFEIHPLVQEDIVNTAERSKFEDYDDYLFFVMKNIDIEKTTHHVDFSQISIIVGKNWILTMRESTPYPIFSPIRNRLIQNKMRMKNFGADFLLYSLLDLVVDRYFILIDMLDDEFSKLEGDIIEQIRPTRPSKPKKKGELAQIHAMFKLKTRIQNLQKSISPLRDMINVNILDETELVSQANLFYFKDLLSHVKHLTESIEMLHEKTTNARDLWMGMLSYRMNNVMQLLAIMSSIFIPLTFLAGVYGMNFKNMPELETRYGYYLLLATMILIAGSMLFFFKRKRWF